MRTSVKLASVGALVEGRHQNPFEVLGPHPTENGGRPATAVRAWLPQCEQVWLVHPDQGVSRPMRRIHPAGVFEAMCPPESESNMGPYQFRTSDSQGNMTTIQDPYAHKPLLTDYDLYLLGEGRHWKLHERLGAQLRTTDGVAGVNFAVWAPNARSVSVVGDFNEWDGRRHPMRKHIPNGVWELFVPELKPGTIYKFRVVGEHGEVVEKSDPVGFAAELPPRTASIVANLDEYEWQDGNWMEERRTTNQIEKPISVYEVHLGSWQQGDEGPAGWLNYRDLAHRLVEYCTEQNFTHIELLPISEHPFTGSWGYQTVGYFAVTSRYGTPEDFMYFVDYFHQHGLGVIIDWVPAHFPRDAHGLRRFDGSALYEHADPRQGEHPDWGTLIFNYDRTEVRNFLMANALFWLDKYHIDGLRVDAVASMLYLDYSRKEGEWIPNEYGGRENLGAISFLKEFNEQAHLQHPGVLTIAEESTAWDGVSRPTTSGGLGFSLKWNMGWMNDSLRYWRHEPIHRKFHHDELTFSLIYAFSENFTLPLSHDEVVHGKGALIDQMPGDLWQKFANLRLLYAYMWTHPGKKLLFMGSEFGQWNEWDCDTTLQWDLLQWDTHKGVQKLVSDLNGFYRSQPALYEQDFDWHGFEWIDCMNHEDCVLAYIRRAKDPQDFLVVALNLTPVPREGYQLGVPQAGFYREVFNSDSQYYDGTNLGNAHGAKSSKKTAQGREHSIRITLPPLAAVVLKPER